MNIAVVTGASSGLGREFVYLLDTIGLEEKPVVAYLIYAAGLGRIGLVKDMPRTEELQMLRVNCEGAITMTSLCMPYMEVGSHIVERCSVAAFQPLPYFSVYAATKVYIAIVWR